MKNLHRIAHRTTSLVLGVFLLLLLPGLTAALDVPQLKGRVNDYASMLSAVTIDQMERSLKQFELDQSTQIVVLTIPSLENASLEEFSIQVVEAWKIGQQGLDNGALLLVAREERKVRIEVGYGLEGSLTDLTAGRIIRGVIVPHFKKGDFDGGIMAGVNTMMGAVRGEFSAKDVPQQPGGEGDSEGFWFLLIMVVFFIGKVLGNHKILAASVSGLLVSIFGLLVLGPKWLFIILLFPVGFIGGLIASSFSALRMGSNSGRGSGYIGGGSLGGGGGFGGGFSGGGGGFGGGGASGGW